MFKSRDSDKHAADYRQAVKDMLLILLFHSLFGNDADVGHHDFIDERAES